MSIIRFTSTKLAAKGKSGILTPDADGYYTCMAGALNALNSAGEIYLADGARELFNSSSTFMRRVKNGCVKSEVGHPEFKKGMSEKEYMARMAKIVEANVCAHIRDVKLDTEYGKREKGAPNRDMIGINIEVAPSGPHGDALKKAFENKHENVCFSIRALTRDFVQAGQTYRVLKRIYNWDWVTEPGISVANKWDSPALESLYDLEIKESDLSYLKRNIPEGLSLESHQEFISDLEVLFKEPEPVFKPKFLSW